jgi:hypothetical protein
MIDRRGVEGEGTGKTTYTSAKGRRPASPEVATTPPGAGSLEEVSAL